MEDNIRRVIADRRPTNVGESHRKLDVRLDYIRVSRGSRMPEIIFKITPPSATQKHYHTCSCKGTIKASRYEV
ncbi:hypothetical protein TNCV_3868861 [Trichonephila clavipes]|nr:hypothetical protein TNCV_3868861 [Trichonephila clavipes]